VDTDRREVAFLEERVELRRTRHRLDEDADLSHDQLEAHFNNIGEIQLEPPRLPG
jgi:hypothetical protein